MIAARALLACTLACAACATTPTVRFGPATRSYEPRDFRAVRDRWTRQVHVRTDFDVALDAHATLFSSDFRAALVPKLAEARRLTELERATLADANRRDDEAFVEFLVLAETGHWEWNDLGTHRTLWTITLVDDRGRQWGPPEVLPEHTKVAELNALYLGITPFTRAWRVRFPRTNGLADAGTRWLELRIAGPLGDTGTALRWTAR